MKMQSLVLVLFVSMFASLASAAGPKAPLDPIDLDLHDKESLQRGLALFTNYCFGCHAMEYARYERAADDLEIPHDIFEENLIFGDAKIGELMTIAMPADQAAAWFGSAPPDLTLTARLRGPEWLYGYLRGFYEDPKKPYGVNNVVFKDVGMPHVLAELGGVCASEPKIGQGVSEVCEEYAVEGSMSPADYDKAIYDLVNFFEYVGEPSKLESISLGKMVLIFLAFLFVFVYFLNKEYWRGIH